VRTVRTSIRIEPPTEDAVPPSKPEVLQGTLDLMVLRTLEMLGPLHGFGIARRVEQLAGNGLELNHGTVYPALVRLEQQGWVRSAWGTSENNRRARFYSLTAAGRRHLAREAAGWERTTAMMARFLEAK
jgi:transcriptional regulator